MPHHARYVLISLGGGLVDATGLVVLAADEDGHWGRVALGIMMPATIGLLLGIVCVLMARHRSHFDAEINITRAKVTELEHRADREAAAAYEFGRRQGALIGPDQVRT